MLFLENLFNLRIKHSTSILVQTKKNVIFAKFCTKFVTFFICFSFQHKKMLKMTNLTSIQGAQHPKLVKKYNICQLKKLFSNECVQYKNNIFCLHSMHPKISTRSMNLNDKGQYWGVMKRVVKWTQTLDSVVCRRRRFWSTSTKKSAAVDVNVISLVGS